MYGFGVVLVEILTGLRAIDLNRPSGYHNLTDWIKPHLQERRKLKKIMDPQLGDKYPIKAALTISKLASKCLAPEPKMRPPMKDVMEILKGTQASTDKTVEVRGQNEWVNSIYMWISGNDWDLRGFWLFILYFLLTQVAWLQRNLWISYACLSS